MCTFLLKNILLLLGGFFQLIKPPSLSVASSSSAGPSKDQDHFRCKWSKCTFTSDEKADLLKHINGSHVRSTGRAKNFDANQYVEEITTISDDEANVSSEIIEANHSGIDLKSSSQRLRQLVNGTESAKIVVSDQQVPVSAIQNVGLIVS